jgi:hypothetical protein
VRHIVIVWSVLGALVLGGFAITVLALNSTTYSASGFVRSYFDALSRRDAEGALELAGPVDTIGEDENASRRLLTAVAISIPSNATVLADTVTETGAHRVVVAYEIDGTARQSTYEVASADALLGLFSRWSFVTPPVAVMYVSVLGDARFRANGIDLVSSTPNEPAPYLVFTPGRFVLDHVSRFLESNDVSVTATEAGASIPTAVDVTANEEFVAAVQAEVDASLDTCATQQVLQPTGCPFGRAVRNRIDTTPIWSIAAYPTVTINRGSSLNWAMPPTDGAAHLLVDIQSIFDGSVSTFDEDVLFQVAYTITIVSENEIVITPAS